MSLYKLNPENDWNPLAEGRFRNFICPCGSGKKVKKCHGRISYMRKEEVEKFRKLCDGATKQRFESEALRQKQKIGEQK